MDRSKGWRHHKNRVKRYKDQHGCSNPWCCGNPRRRPLGWKTRHELRADLDLQDWPDSSEVRAADL